MKKTNKKNNNKKVGVLSLVVSKFSRLKEKASQIKKTSYATQETVDLPEVKLDLDKVILDIAPISVFKATLTVLAVLIGAYLLFMIGNTLLIFFISFFIAAALDPLIDFLQDKKIPRAIGILLVYVIIFFLVAMFFVYLLPLIAEQLIALAGAVNDFVLKVSQSPTLNLPFGQQLKPYIAELYKAIDIKVVAVQLKDSLQLISSQLLNLGGNIWSIILQISNGLLNFILILILVFFMTVDEQSLENFCVSIFPEKYTVYITQRLQMVKVKIGEWIRGQLMVSIVAAVISFIGLAIAGVQFSLLISVITGICMIVPVFGRVIACILVLPIVMNQSPALALFVIIYYFGISQVENNIIVPLLMNKALGLSPIIIIFALMIGFQFLGVLGLILAIPIATIVSIFAKDIGKRIHSRI
jgi:predicted PurR-regulated permease PerM